MNETLKIFARKELLSGLAQLPDDWQYKFKLMYGRKLDRRGLPTRDLDETAATPIDVVVSEIPDEKLDWAMQQVENSIAKLAKSATA